MRILELIQLTVLQCWMDLLYMKLVFDVQHHHVNQSNVVAVVVSNEQGIRVIVDGPDLVALLMFAVVVWRQKPLVNVVKMDQLTQTIIHLWDVDVHEDCRRRHQPRLETKYENGKINKWMRTEKYLNYSFDWMFVREFITLSGRIN